MIHRVLGRSARAARSTLHRRKGGRKWIAASAALALGAGVLAASSVTHADDPSGCDFATSFSKQGVPTFGCSNPLTGSTFAGGDGNLNTSPTTYGTTDWQNVAGLNTGIDNASGGTDNAFGQGTKEDDSNASVVTGSIPPNKSDLSRFYEASEQLGNGHVLLYLAWERSNVLGNANMDFEISQASTTYPASGPVTINRTAGDLLVTYDFTNGGGKPVIGILRWLTSSTVPTVPGFATNSCFSANSFPCWGDRKVLNGVDSIAAVNNVDAVTDPLQSGSPSLPALTFGETAIDLTDAGVFGSGCQAFGSAMLRSRASSSFTAEVKDFVAPIPVSVSNCAGITIKKITENGTGTFSFTTTGTGLSAFDLTTLTAGTAVSKVFSTLNPGSYTVTESGPPATWTLKSLSCTSTGTGTSTSTSGATATITLGQGGNATCTYTNHTNLSPSISTTLSATSVAIGETMHDSATLTGATSDAGGTVTYKVFTTNDCSGTPQVLTPDATVTNGIVGDSPDVSFNAAGDYYFVAYYSGDANNNSAQSGCAAEHLVVNPNSPSISTTLSATSVAIGETMHDSATLSGATSDAGGTVHYVVFTNDTCSGSPAFDAGTVNVTNGVVPDSNGISFNAAGDYYFVAYYSGDANNNSAQSGCAAEHLVVNPNQSAISTAQNLLPNDTATLSGLTSNAGGTVTFSLFDPSDATCASTPAYTEDVSVSGNGSYDTTNTTFLATAEGTWRWLVSYSGDANNVGSTSACGVERFTIANS